MDEYLRKKFFKQLEIENKLLVDKKTGFLKKSFSKYIKCPLCNSSKKEHEVLFIKNGHKFVRCNNCELIFTNPQVNLDIVNNNYKSSKSENIWVKLQESKAEQKWKYEVELFFYT